jgi:ESS family glutamate:Na+ symporter
MADPEERTQARVGYAYKQLAYEPFFGGGLLTALAVPLIASRGVAAFGMATGVITVVLMLWGLGRARSARLGDPM